MADSEAQVTTRPPPPYNDINDVLAQPRELLTTLNDKLPISQTLTVTNLHSSRIENRRISLRDEGAGTQEYMVTFQANAPSHEIRSMELHRGMADGALEAKINFPPIDDVIAVITIDGKKVQVVEQKNKSGSAQPSSSKADKHVSKSIFAVGDLTWRSSDQYLHRAKGKSRVGDLELVAATGHVVAVFLNEWSGAPDAKDLGKISLTEQTYKAADGSSVTALAIASLLVVAIHVSWRTRDGAKEFFKEIMQGGLLLCNVM